MVAGSDFTAHNTYYTIYCSLHKLKKKSKTQYFSNRLRDFISKILFTLIIVYY